MGKSLFHPSCFIVTLAFQSSLPNLKTSIPIGMGTHMHAHKEGNGVKITQKNRARKERIQHEHIHEERLYGFG